MTIMRPSHVLALLGLVLAAVGATVAAPGLWVTGLAVAVTQFVVAETEDETVRGLFAFLSVPVILTVAILAAS